jgi:hypothetical protein
MEARAGAREVKDTVLLYKKRRWLPQGEHSVEGPPPDRAEVVAGTGLWISDEQQAMDQSQVLGVHLPPEG